jgi:hypothetical protein
MFGFQGGESRETVARKRAYMRDPQRRWPFLTNFDASTIKNEMLLATLVGFAAAGPCRSASGRTRLDGGQEILRRA